MAMRYEEALEKVLAAARPAPGESIALREAIGRTLARDVKLARDHPPYNRVAMDGYAVAEGALDRGAVRLRIAAHVQAGTRPIRHPGGATCVKVMTGAVAPTGTVYVLPVEHVTEADGHILVPEGVKARANICWRGEDAKAGQILLRAGEAITPIRLALLAANGVEQVRVAKQPRVAVFSTGQEVVAIGKKPSAWQVVDCNSFFVAGLIAATGLGHPESMGIIEDDPKALRRQIAQALKRCDIVILSGGVSKGDFDYVPEVVASLGGEELVHGVATKPGRPLYVARRGAKTIFGLPGNPVAVLATTLFYVMPFLRQMAGRAPLLPLAKARLASEVKRDPARLAWIPCRIAITEDGVRQATPVSHRGSGDIPSLAGASGFAIVARGEGLVASGDLVEVLEWNTAQ